MFRFVHWLEYPDWMGWVYLYLVVSVGEEILEFFELYLRDHIQCDNRIHDRLGIYACPLPFRSMSLPSRTQYIDDATGVPVPFCVHSDIRGLPSSRRG